MGPLDEPPQPLAGRHLNSLIIAAPLIFLALLAGVVFLYCAGGPEGAINVFFRALFGPDVR